MVVVLLASPAAGQGIAARWDLEIRGPALNENADLRLDGRSGRILLQFDDSAFQRLDSLRVGDGRISFVLSRGHRRFEGSLTPERMEGTVRDADGATMSWMALPLLPGSTRWPVAPRVTARQLVMGSSATSVRIPGAWLAAMPTLAQLEAEDTRLATLTGIPMVTTSDRRERSRRIALGLDDSVRAVVRALMARIAATPAADATFRALFATGPGWKIDLHDAALAEALHYQSGFTLTEAASGLRRFGDLATTADSSAIRESAWRLWCRAATDSVAVFAGIDSLARQDPMAAAAVRALLAGYDGAVAWWRRAVHWLLVNRWLPAPAGRVSPQQLMGMFWSVDSLPLPEIDPVRFGDAAAMPVPGAASIGRYLFRPRNGVAAEWLAGAGLRQAFDSWLPLRWGESPLILVQNGRTETVVSPWAQAEARSAAFFGETDAIRLDPGITPLIAVVVFLHEWHHLIAAERRLAGPHPAALLDDGTQLHLLELDPWIAEGFAEWATEETLRPVRDSAALLLFTQAEKRLALAARDASDPHLLGYRMVRAALAHMSGAALRDALVLHLHDPAGLARVLHLSGTGAVPPLTLNRPPNASVIPEVSFTWDDGLAFDISRRLLIPPSRPEH
ncbi:MAG: hypothetical protein ACREK8_03495 [Gemmatimonadales bacterium]